MGWLGKLLGLNARVAKPKNTENVLVDYRARQSRMEKAGTVDGAHYTGHVERVKQLKRDKQYSEAINLLLKLVDATEAEAKAAGQGMGVAPWYYEQLAIIYRKEKRIVDEVAILERYEVQTKAPGAGSSKLAERLKKARSSLQ